MIAREDYERVPSRPITASWKWPPFYLPEFRYGSGLTVTGASDTCTESRAKQTIRSQERGIAVIVNRPFEGCALIGRLRGEPLPGWPN